jgi:nitronate monooxygenase
MTAKCKLTRRNARSALRKRLSISGCSTMAQPAERSSLIHAHYPWTRTPLLSSAPMRLISGPSLAVAVSRAGGLGFLGAGAGSDLSTLLSNLQEASLMLSSSPITGAPEGILPIGVGFLNWGADLGVAVRVLSDLPLKPAAVWFFAPKSTEDLVSWTSSVRAATENRTKIWVQVGTLASAVEAVKVCAPDVLVIQGSDAGGHGLIRSSSIISLLPEVSDALMHSSLWGRHGPIPLVAAGGIVDGRGVAAALMLGASGVSIGTRFLTSREADISQGYKQAVMDARDGGVTTARSLVYDNLRGTTGWPESYNARGLINKSFRDWEAGMPEEENKKLYEEAARAGDQGWGQEDGRMATYAGTGVGLINSIKPAGEIVEEILEEVKLVVRFGGGMLRV